MYVLNALLVLQIRGLQGWQCFWKKSLIFTNAAFKKNEDSNIVKYDCILK